MVNFCLKGNTKLEKKKKEKEKKKKKKEKEKKNPALASFHYIMKLDILKTQAYS